MFFIVTQRPCQTSHHADLMSRSAPLGPTAGEALYRKQHTVRFHWSPAANLPLRKSTGVRALTCSWAIPSGPLPPQLYESAVILPWRPRLGGRQRDWLLPGLFSELKARWAVPGLPLQCCTVRLSQPPMQCATMGWHVRPSRPCTAICSRQGTKVISTMMGTMGAWLRRVPMAGRQPSYLLSRAWYGIRDWHVACRPLPPSAATCRPPPPL